MSPRLIRHLGILAGFAALLLVMIGLGLAFGSEPVSLLAPTASEQAILWQIRLPRVLLGAAVGACLASAGAGLQSLLRNPLAEPYLLGVSNGAALGTMAALFFAGAIGFLQPVLAFVGAVFSIATVYALARGKVGVSVERLVLAGVIVTTFLSSVIILLTSLLDATRLRSFTFWLLGDLSQAGFTSFWMAAGAACVGTLLLVWKAGALNLMMIGERDAFDFGVDVRATRITVLLAAAGMVGASVAAGGSVGFVGLIVPHIVRLAFGSDNRGVLPYSALGGAAFVVFADLVARTAIAPRELPVGAVTAIFGCPLFIALLRRG
ncbi:MAG: iron ABC transporter permease [Pyrinomonadaceae bacterium]